MRGLHHVRPVPGAGGGLQLPAVSRLRLLLLFLLVALTGLQILGVRRWTTPPPARTDVDSAHPQLSLPEAVLLAERNDRRFRSRIHVKRIADPRAAAAEKKSRQEEVRVAEEFKRLEKRREVAERRQVADAEAAAKAAETAANAKRMRGLVTRVREVARQCNDTDTQCAAWARGGECDRNPRFMDKACPAACGVCEPLWAGRVGKEMLYHITLSNGVLMPAIGYGTAGLGSQTKRAVAMALEKGYKLIDSAQAREWYREDMVGQAIKESGVDRKSLFITSKLHPRDHSYHRAVNMVLGSLKDLHTEYLDLMLLHYPFCWVALCGANNKDGDWRESWKALEDMYDRGQIRAIGVSNFDVEQLQELLKVARIPPHVVQRNSDIFRFDAATQHFCKRHDIAYQYSSNPVLGSQAVGAIAARLGKSPAQVLLRYGLYSGQGVIPRSSNPDRMAENLRLAFDLESSDLLALQALDGINPPKNNEAP